MNMQMNLDQPLSTEEMELLDDGAQAEIRPDRG